GSRADEVDLSERGHVDDPHPSTDRAMFLGLQLEPRRPGPAEAALVGAGPPPGPTRLEVLGPFPPVFGAEDRAQVLHPVVQGAGPAWPAPLVGVVRVAKEVVVAVRLSGQLRHVAVIVVHRAKAPGPVGIEVELGLLRGDQLCQRLADSASTAEPVNDNPAAMKSPRMPGTGPTR